MCTAQELLNFQAPGRPAAASDSQVGLRLLVVLAAVVHCFLDVYCLGNFGKYLAGTRSAVIPKRSTCLVGFSATANDPLTGG
jgi:hypothetical protein